MSEPTPSGSLGPLAIIAALLLLLGGGAYFAMTDAGSVPETSSERAPVADSAPAASTSSPGPVAAPALTTTHGVVDDPDRPAQPGRAVPSSTVLSLAGGPKVTPDTYQEEVLATLRGSVPKLQACAANWVSRNPNLLGKAFFVFRIAEDGKPIEATLQYKTVRSDALNVCFLGTLGGLVFDRGAAEAKVFWSVELGGDAVVRPIGPTEATPQ